MADFFKLIKANVVERTKPKKTSNEQSLTKRLDLDDLIIGGEEEKRYQEKKPRKPSIQDELDIEIGRESEKKNPIKDVEKLDFIKLSKESDKKQTIILKREYLNLLDKMEEISSEMSSLSKSSSSTSIELHQEKKQNFKMKELVRLIGGLIPDGTELRQTLDNNSWTIEDVEELLLEKITQLVDRAKNADVYAAEMNKDATNEIKQLKRKCIQFESQISKYQDENQQLRDAFTAQQQQVQQQYMQMQQQYQEQFQQQMQPLQQQFQTLQQEQQQTHQQHQTLQQQYQALTQQYQVLQQEHQALKQEHETLKNTPTPLPTFNIPTPTFTPPPITETKPPVVQEPTPEPPVIEPTPPPIPEPVIEPPTQPEPITEPELPSEPSIPEPVIEPPTIPSTPEPPVIEPTPPPISEPVIEPPTQPTPPSIEPPTIPSTPEPPAIEPPTFAAPSLPTFDMPTFEPIPQPNIDIPSVSAPEEEVEENIEEDDEDIDTHLLLDMEKHVDLMAESRQYIIEVVGKTGISRNQELREFLENDEKGKKHFQRGTKFSYQEMSASTKGLKDSGYLISEKVNLGSKGGYNFQVFELSDTGKAIYKILTKKKPVKPEKELIVAQHKSLEHGYLIKDCATEFKEMGYTVYTERKDLRFDLPNGKRKDFDLIVEEGSEKCYIEVERGTHTDEDFFNAMDKIYQVMQGLKIAPAQFYFISPNEQALFGKTKRQFFLWIKQRLGGIEEVKGKIVVNFATFDKIKKRGKNIWETIKL